MTDITIAAGGFPHYEGAPTEGLEIWIVANRPYTTPDSKMISASYVPEKIFLVKAAVEVDEENIVQVPELIVDATEDAIDNPEAELGAYLMTSQGRPVTVLGVFKSFIVPATPMDTTWEALARYQVPVATPTAFRSIGTDYQEITIDWLENDTIDSFVVQRRKDSNHAWAEAGTVDGDVNEFVDSTDIEIGASYDYRIQAIRDDGKKSRWTPPITVSAIELPIVDDLTAAPDGFTQLDLTWTFSPDVDGYKLETAGPTGAFTVLAMVTVAPGTASATGLVPGATRRFRIRPYKGDHYGPYSAILTTAATELPVPSHFTVSIINIDKLDAHWTDQSGLYGIGIDGTSIEIAGEGDDFTVAGTKTDTSGLFHATSLTPGEHYRMRIRYYLGSHFGPYSTIVTKTTPDIQLPGHVTATPLNLTTNRVRWIDTNTYEAGYVVERSVHDEEDWSAAGDETAANVQLLDDTDATPGVTYDYRVKATNAVHDSGWVTAAPCTTLTLSNPTGLGALKSRDDIIISYSDPNAFEEGYEIFHGVDGGAMTSLHTTAPNVTTYTHTAPSEGHVHNYKVRAVSAPVNSGFTAVGSATMPLPAPDDITLAPTSSTVVDITTDSVTDADSYDIDRSTSTSGPWTNVATSASSFPVADSGRTAAATYYYRARAKNAATGVGPYCAPVSVTMPAAPPGMPSAPVATAINDGDVDFSFSAVSGATSYSVTRSVNGGSFDVLSGSWAPGSNDDTDVTSGDTVAYKVTATNSGGSSTSAASNTVTVPDPVPTGALICDGDSQTRGYGASDGAHTWPSVSNDLLAAAGSNYVGYNSGVDGAKLTDLIADAVAQITAHLVVDSPKNAYVIFAGGNDLGTEGASGATCYSRLQTLIGVAYGAGINQVFVCTIPPRVDITSGAKETARLAFNSAIRSGQTADNFIAIDLVSDSRLNDYTDHTYFSVADEIHIIDAGLAIIAAMISAALLAYDPPVVYTISGTIFDDSSSPISGVLVTMTGATVGSTTTNGSGIYTETNVPRHANVTFTPTKTGYVFSPSSRNIPDLTGNATKNFTGTVLLSGSFPGWSNKLAVTEDGSTHDLTSTGATGWGSTGATSTKTATNTAGKKFVWQMVNNTAQFIMGASGTYVNANFDTKFVGAYFDATGTFKIWANFNLVGSNVGYVVGDIFELGVKDVSGTPRFYLKKNGTEIQGMAFDSLTVPATWFIDVAIYLNGSVIPAPLATGFI
jgi:uncharacterized repeat protein (TIGR01451 family)